MEQIKFDVSSCEKIRAQMEHYDNLLYITKQEFYVALFTLRQAIDDLVFSKNNDVELRLCIQQHLEQMVHNKATIKKYERLRKQLNDLASARDEQALDKVNPYHPWRPVVPEVQSLTEEYVFEKFGLPHKVEAYAQQWLTMDTADFQVYLQQEQEPGISGRQLIELCTDILDPVTLRLIINKIDVAISS